MQRFSRRLALLLLSMSVASCAVYQNKDVGRVTGAISGGILGSFVGQGAGRALAIGSGLVIGYVIGDALGTMLDDTDNRRISNALFYNQTNEESCWINGRGVRYVMVPTSDQFAANDIPECRRYELTMISTHGKMLRESGVACMLPDGTWEVLRGTWAPSLGIYEPIKRT